MSIFHLAIPTHDLKLSKDFYAGGCGAVIGREYSDYVIFNFFGHQVVAHLNPEGISKIVTMYPRHFGIIFEDKNTFDKLYSNAKNSNLNFYEELFERFVEKSGWHWSFFLVDPSNNLIEFKYYKSHLSIFGNDY
jgi:extradiol dioxygenase family protein